MAFEIFFESRAYQDIEEAIKYYSLKSNSAANSFYLEIEAAVDYLRSHPFAFEEKRFEKHEIPLKVFPYSMVYEVRGGIIYILSVFNTKQDPSKKP